VGRCAFLRILLSLLLSTLSFPQCPSLSSSLPRPCLRSPPRSGVLRLRGGQGAADAVKQQQQGSPEEDLFDGLIKAADRGRYLSEMYNKVYAGAESDGFVHRQQVLLASSSDLPPSLNSLDQQHPPPTPTTFCRKR
jgi:hypothetical protein